MTNSQKQYKINRLFVGRMVELFVIIVLLGLSLISTVDAAGLRNLAMIAIIFGIMIELLEIYFNTWGEYKKTWSFRRLIEKEEMDPVIKNIEVVEGVKKDE